ncbi:pitrilysin family protein [Trichocoleus sp. FACHB-262]|uniref:M16 family metallopeptidase n=1 Tax=Trichocoleus sp. FACHB-262 TaxID=2692869 RepID=UPI0028C3935B|nr:pitrilysin family protein [Trichocoleus sp. FACHB-262]
MDQSVTPFLQNRQVHRTVLENGMVVLAVENPAADIIAARIFIRAGSIWERPEQAGLSHLVASVLTKGTDQLSSLEIAERVESVGAGLSTDAATDYFLMSLKTVSSDFVEILELAGQLLRSPTFPESEVELERRLTLQSIRSQQEQPFAVAMEQLRQAMYQDHPYALSAIGTAASVAQLSRSDLQQYHQTYFRPDNIVISLVGRITPEAAIAQIQEVFGDWQAPDSSIPALTLPVVPVEPQQVVTAQETQQSIIMLGYLAPAAKSQASTEEAALDYIALKLLNTYLGNGLSSRLFVELREKRGLAYEVSAFYPTRLGQSQFVTYMGTAPDNTATALEGLQYEVQRLCDAPLSEAELQTAKNKLLGQYALGKQTNSQIAQVLGWYETLGLGVEFDAQFQKAIVAVTPAAAQQAACRHFTQPYVSLVGPAASVNAIAVPVTL